MIQSRGLEPTVGGITKTPQGRRIKRLDYSWMWVGVKRVTGLKMT